MSSLWYKGQVVKLTKDGVDIYGWGEGGWPKNRLGIVLGPSAATNGTWNTHYNVLVGTTVAKYINADYLEGA